MNAPSTLITGGSGFIGLHLGRRLASQGHRVTLLDQEWSDDGAMTDLAHAYGERIRLVTGDVTDPSSWEHELDGIDVLVHSAGVHRAAETANHPTLTEDVNVGGTRAVLEVSINHGIDRFVFLSTSKVYGETGPGGASEDAAFDPLEHYARTKVAAEALCRAADDAGAIEVAIVRPFSVYGPGQDVRTGYVGALLSAAETNSSASFAGDPTIVRDFVHIDAVTALIAELAVVETLPAVVWNAGSGRATSLAELVSIFVDVSGFEHDVTYRAPSPGTLRHSYADVTRVQALLGDIDPSLADGLRETLSAHSR